MLKEHKNHLYFTLFFTKNLILYTFLLALSKKKFIILFLFAFSNSGNAASAEVVAEIKFSKSNIFKITDNQVQKSVKKELGLEYESFNDEQKTSLRKAMLERLIERRLLLNQAKKLNLFPTKNSVDKFINVINEKLENTSSVNKELDKHGVEQKAFKVKLREELAIKELLDKKVFKEIEISKEEVEAEKKSPRYKSPKQFCLRILQLEHSKNLDLVKIKKLAEQDFEATARKFSSAKKGIEPNCLTENQLPQQVAKVVKNIALNVVSEVIKTDSLSYLIKLEKTIESELKALSDDDAKKLILRNKRQALMETYLKKLKEKIKIVRHT